MGIAFHNVAARTKPRHARCMVARTKPRHTSSPFQIYDELLILRGYYNPLNNERLDNDRDNKNMEASAAAAFVFEQQALMSMQSCRNPMNKLFQSKLCSSYYYANTVSCRNCDGCRKSGENCWYAEALPSLLSILRAEALSSPQYYKMMFPCAVGEKMRKESR